MLANWAGHSLGRSWQQQDHVQVAVVKVSVPGAEVFESAANKPGGFGCSLPKILPGPSAKGSPAPQAS